MESHYDDMQTHNARLDVLTGAQHFNVNELQVTQARNVHNHHNHQYRIYNTTGQPMGLSQILNPIKDASHKRNRQVAPPDSRCLPGTREDVLEEVRMWVIRRIMGESELSEPHLPKHICWMYGSVGCGKSAVAQNLAEEFEGQNRLAASFFFFRNAGERSFIHRLAATLAHQLSVNVPGTKAEIERRIIEEPELLEPTCSLSYQLEHLVFRPLAVALTGPSQGTPNPGAYLIVVDGLDECVDKTGISTFIDNFIAFFSRNPSIPLRLFITSRIEEHIRTRVEGSTDIHFIDLVSKSSREDLTSFMKVTFVNARKHDRALQALGDQWPAGEDTDKLVDYCDGSFIFGSTLAKYILIGAGDHDPLTPMERLPLALKMNPGLDGIYIDVLSRAQHLPHFLIIISTIASVGTPLSISALSGLLGLSTYEIIRVLVVLQAILQVPGRDDVPVTLFHTSLRDFLVDRNRSGSFHSRPSHHTFLMHCCLNVLFGSDPSSNAACCKYAIVYWAHHLQAVAQSDNPFGRSVLEGKLYDPTDTGHEAKDRFKSRWMASRPLNLALSQADWQTMVENLKKAEHLLFQWAAAKSNWKRKESQGRGSRYPPIIALTSVDPCSIKDILEGLLKLDDPTREYAPGTLPPLVYHMKVKLHGDFSINVNFEKTFLFNSHGGATPDGGCKIVIPDGLQ